MKPRIFINIHYLEIGGAETSLIGLLQTLNPSRVDVDLFINEHRGEMMAYIPEWVNVLPECRAYTMIERPIREVLKAGYLHIAAARLWARVRFRAYMRRKRPIDGSAIFGYVGKYVTPMLPSLKHLGMYDLAVAFLPPYGVVSRKVRARKKICWVHTDYTQIDVNRQVELETWRRYDNMVCVCDDVARNFCKEFPELRDKVVRIENILSPKLVRQRAGEGGVPCDMPRVKNGYTLLTVGRFSYPKKMEDIPAICRLLTEQGLAVRWYIVGYGAEEERIRRAIIDEGMEDRVILLGKRENPYPYIKACDWYVQPSRYEGKSVVVREAQILGKPVIITAYATAASQVEDGIDGVIVPMAIEECANGIAAAISDKSLGTAITGYLSSHDYGNEKEIDKIYDMFRS